MSLKLKAFMTNSNQNIAFKKWLAVASSTRDISHRKKNEYDISRVTKKGNYGNFLYKDLFSVNLMLNSFFK